jgi:hypothetical protein
MGLSQIIFIPLKTIPLTQYQDEEMTTEGTEPNFKMTENPPLITPWPETPDWQQELVRRFTYHPPKGDQPERYNLIRSKAGELAALLADACKESRERNLAFTKLEEAVFWANAAIARNE